METRERVWDKFLTPQDVLLDKERGEGKSAGGSGIKPALLIVDNFIAAVGEARLPFESARQEWPLSCGPEGWDAVQATIPVLEAARANSIPVVHIVQKIRSYRGFLRFAWNNDDNKPGDPRDLAGNEIVPELRPIAGEAVIYKDGPSGFAGSRLQFHLSRLGCDTVAIAGGSTSGCIRATAVDAATHQYFVAVIEECTYDRTQASHAMSLYDLDRKYGDVVSAEQTIEYFRAVHGTTERGGNGGTR